MTKLETALRIIAGTTMARSHWTMFFEAEELPEYMKGSESVEAYHSRVNVFVRNKACQWLVEQLEYHADVTFRTEGNPATGDKS